MSVKQMVKANMITQLIWMVFTAVIFFVIGLVATREENKKKFTKDGFKSDAMQDLYDRYNKVKS